jgi:CheY-like chemotaxis protein
MPRHPVLLIVEDDAVLRELCRAEMRVARFDVHVAEDGLQALRFLDQQRPDIIVLDLGLPHVSGVDIYNELRANGATKDIPIVICTGADPVPELPNTIVVRKPCAPEALAAAALEALESLQAAWLYVRGDQSVRLVRDPGKHRVARLLVLGPGSTTAEFFEKNPTDCSTRRSAIERRLLSEGYTKLPLYFGDRRDGGDRRSPRRMTPHDRRLRSSLHSSDQL